MSTKMVQENHEDNINTQWNQCEILVYFGTIYMEHPVYGLLNSILEYKSALRMYGLLNINLECK